MNKTVLSIVLLFILPIASIDIHSARSIRILYNSDSGPYDQYINTSATLRVAMDHPPASLNPVETISEYDWKILQYIFDPLAMPNPLDYFDVRADLPWVAKSWEFTQTSNRSGYWTIKIRDNIQFFDGKPLTVYDLNFTYRFIFWLGPHNDPWYDVYCVLNHTEVIDNSTIRVYVNTGGIVTARYVLDIVIFPRHIYGKGETWNSNCSGEFPNWNVTRNMVLNYEVHSPNDPILTGYGSFRLKSWYPSEAESLDEVAMFIMERNPNYFRRAVDENENIIIPWRKWSEMVPPTIDLHGPYVKYLQINVIQDIKAIKNATLSFDLDLVADTELYIYSNEFLSDGFTIIPADSLSFGHTLINTRLPVPAAGNISLLSKPEFRRALAYAYDKYAICNEVWGGWAQPLDVPVPRTMGDWSIEYTGEPPGSYYTHNKEAALAELEKLGIKDYDNDSWLEWNASDSNSEITITIEGVDFPYIRKTISILAQNVEEIGIHVEEKIYEPFNPPWPFGTYELLFFGFGLSRIPIFMEYFASWSWISYYGGWHNTTYDELIRDAFYVQTNWTKIKEEVRRAEIIYWYEQPLIPIYQRAIAGVYYEWNGSQGVAGAISIPGSSIDNYYTYLHVVKPRAGAPAYSLWISPSILESSHENPIAVAVVFLSYVWYMLAVVVIVVNCCYFGRKNSRT